MGVRLSGRRRGIVSDSESRIQAGARVDVRTQTGEARLDVPGGKMSEERLCKSEVGPFAELVELERV